MSGHLAATVASCLAFIDLGHLLLAYSASLDAVLNSFSNVATSSLAEELLARSVDLVVELAQVASVLSLNLPAIRLWLRSAEAGRIAPPPRWTPFARSIFRAVLGAGPLSDRPYSRLLTRCCAGSCDRGAELLAAEGGPPCWPGLGRLLRAAADTAGQVDDLLYRLAGRPVRDLGRPADALPLEDLLLGLCPGVSKLAQSEEPPMVSPFLAAGLGLAFLGSLRQQELPRSQAPDRLAAPPPGSLLHGLTAALPLEAPSDRPIAPPAVWRCFPLAFLQSSMVPLHLAAPLGCGGDPGGRTVEVTASMTAIAPSQATDLGLLAACQVSLLAELRERLAQASQLVADRLPQVCSGPEAGPLAEATTKITLPTGPPARPPKAASAVVLENRQILQALCSNPTDAGASACPSTPGGQMSPPAAHHSLAQSSAAPSIPANARLNLHGRTLVVADTNILLQSAQAVWRMLSLKSFILLVPSLVLSELVDYGQASDSQARQVFGVLFTLSEFAATTTAADPAGGVFILSPVGQLFYMPPLPKSLRDIGPAAAAEAAAAAGEADNPAMSTAAPLDLPNASGDRPLAVELALQLKAVSNWVWKIARGAPWMPVSADHQPGGRLSHTRRSRRRPRSMPGTRSGNGAGGSTPPPAGDDDDDDADSPPEEHDGGDDHGEEEEDTLRPGRSTADSRSPSPVPVPVQQPALAAPPVLHSTKKLLVRHLHHFRRSPFSTTIDSNQPVDTIITDSLASLLGRSWNLLPLLLDLPSAGADPQASEGAPGAAAVHASRSCPALPEVAHTLGRLGLFSPPQSGSPGRGPPARRSGRRRGDDASALQQQQQQPSPSPPPQQKPPSSSLGNGGGGGGGGGGGAAPDAGPAGWRQIDIVAILLTHDKAMNLKARTRFADARLATQITSVAGLKVWVMQQGAERAFLDALSHHPAAVGDAATRGGGGHSGNGASAAAGDNPLLIYRGRHRESPQTS
ncbi:hypothetical protein H696_01574 [Fonticula alba]|uniref:PIN domain-containing protein n=1 Tax=Fonticula alba TaxID=691883 RepID=A0A058ZFB5_FONAL|nr:hypothetical protein H696_01574 [Fonticula alba]KCV72172.1 hypothetical protein H696_01574 [Fonticula alba]|eukprot:XP_009493750.1 hypothetical protein H696_01574 [Fonticula alba]